MTVGPVDTWLIVGLGNTGPEYASTRHNIGQMVLAELANRLGTSFRSAGGRSHAGLGALTADGRLQDGTKVVLAKSTGYMNTSGAPVQHVMTYYDVPADHVIIVHDDLDLPFDTLRLKRGGGHGGHNGIRDIIAVVGTKDFLRVRVGIGRPPGRMPVSDFVLKPFTRDEREELPFVLTRAADAAEKIVMEGLQAAQLTYHTAQ